MAQPLTGLPRRQGATSAGPRLDVGGVWSDSQVTPTATANDRVVVIDADQAAVVEAILGGGHHVVLGAPGTGLTTTALETFVAWSEVQPPESALLLVPTRQRAARLRDALSRRLQRTTGSVLVRTPASLAYSILRLRASHLGEPPPTLVSGPEQDTVLAELIVGHLGGEGISIGWPDRIGPETLRLPAFRDELRDLLMRAAEAGLDGAGLEALGEQHDRPEWCAAGRLLTEYGDVMALGELTPDRGARYDAATIVDQAVVALRHWDAEVSPETRPRWSLVLHDDYQDSTLATARLLTALADGGARVGLFGDPDRGVQSFRGGQPSLLDVATRAPGAVDGGLGARVHVLGTSYRHGTRLREAVRALTTQLPALGDDRRRQAEPGGPEPEQQEHPAVVDHLLLPTAAQEVAAIAQQLRIAHLRHEVPWSQMAVVVRTGARVGEIRRGLRTAGIPLAAATPDRPLREEPAVRPLLVALRCVVEDEVTTDAAAELLLSPLGGLDAVSMRSLRRVLRQRDGAGAPSDELVPRMLVRDRDPDALADLPPRLQRAAEAVAGVLDAGRAALAEDPRSTEMVLWAMWDATDLASQWQDRALAGGAAADRADADLDAVVALFKAAEQFTDRTTGADPRTFLEHLATQDFAADTLAARGEDSETVAVHTAASAAGSEWDLVVVAGVQEDSWPDLRIRDTLLGAQQLADITTARDAGLRRTEGADLSEALRSARADVLADELRAFVAACSRARRTLLLTAVLDTDARPSTFYEMLLPPGPDGTSTGLPRPSPVTAALDLRGLVGELRAALHGEDARAAAALQVLEHLRTQGVMHADPVWWPERLAPTSDAPPYDPARPVLVSPSAVEKATSCPLHWALSTAGGRKPSSQAQNVGNLIHEIAAELPHGSLEELQAELARRWHELGLDDAWVSRQERARAEEMVRRLAAYLAERPGELAVEADFDVEIEVDGGRARVRGRMDRVERTEDGLRVIDLKTGASVPSVEQTARHAQLGAYQLAVEHGAFDDTRPQGGSLVYLGTGARGATMRHQDPLPADADPGWAHELIAQTVRTLTSAQLPAQQNPMCGYCQVRTSCPVQPEGGRVTDR